MTPRNESKRKSMRDFLESYLQRDVTYRAGSIYEAYLNEGGSAEITRKDFEMFIRDQVIKDDGLLKQVSHGVYEIRTDPQDRGVLFARGSQCVEEPDTSLAGILDDSMEMTDRIKAMFGHLDRLDGISFPAQMELSRLKASLLRSMDQAVTGITATMAWCEDNMGMEPQTEAEAMTMGGMNL